MAQIRQKENRFTYALTFIFVVTCCGIVAGSILLYRFENARLITDNSIELTAIVKLKAKQISDYRSERFSEANFVFENASFMSDVTTYRSNPRSLQNQAQLDNWLLPILKNHNYEAISIIDTNGVIFYGIGNYDTKRIKETFRFGKQSLMENKINIGNLILYHADSTYHLEIFVPLIRTTSSSSEKIGVVNFTIDPTIELFELMQSWPIESRTAEVLVVRKEGDQVIYQNELRFKKNTALKLAFSVDTNNFIAVRAVQGETGVQTGTDYRGHEVLFTAKRVPNSDWFVVAKIDTNEVFEVLTTVASLIFSLMTALLLATGTAFFIVLHGHRMKQLKIEIQSVDAVKRLNRVYQVLSNVNQAIVRINDRGELLNEICRIANDDGGFRLCWVGFVNEETGLIEPFSKAGAASSYLKYITVSTNGSIPAGQGPVGKAFQTGKPVVFNNIWTQFQLAPWKENAIKYRLRSAAAFPLKGSSGPIGAIGFYSDQFNFFTIEEVKLLEELSADLSYALLNIEREESSKIAEQALLESEDRYRDLVENSLDIICTHDMNGKILSLNKRGAQLLDYAQDDLLQKNLRDILAPEIRKEFDVYLSEIKQHGSARGNMLVQTSSGKKRVWEYYNTLRTEGVSSPIVRGTAQDITERKRAETALRESENIFKKLFEESTDPILLLDDTGFIDFNNSAVSILGYNSKEELFNKKPWELSPEKQPDGRLSSEKAEAMIKKALDQGYNRFEWIHSKSDGTVFPVEVMLTSIMIKGKQSYYTVWRDISERKRIEVELRESEMRYRSVSQSANDAIITINSHGKVLNWNSGAEKIFGYTEAEIIEAGLAKIIPQRYGDQHIKGMKRVAQGGESRILGKTVELFGIHKNGKEFPIELSIAGWETPSGKCYTGIIRDITARRHAEQTLLLQSSALNAAANGIVITNSDGVIEWVNQAFSALTGYASEEAVGKNPRDLVKSGVHDQAYYKHMWDTILEGKIWHGEITNRRKNGTFYIEEQIITPLKNEQGKITHFIAVKQDITERKKAEEALRDSIERFQLISRATNDAVWDWDITTDKTWWNDRFYSLFGFAHDDEHTSLKSWAAKIHPDDRERVLEHFRDALNGISQGWADEFRYQLADGSYGFIYDRAFIIRDDSGKALRMIGSMIDMTLFKKAEQKLQQSENRLRTIVEAEPECVKTLASNGTLLSMNAAGLRMIEAENADQVIGKSVYGLIDPTDRDAFKQLLKNVFDGLSGSLQFQIIGLKGNRRWLDTHAVPLRDENGNINSMLGVTRDVTERRNAEENLKENEAKLKVILESTADGILAVDLEGAVIMANPRFFEMWQIPDSIQESKDDRVLLDFVLEQLVDPEAFLTKVKMLYGSNDHSMDTLNFKDGRVFERLSAPLLSGTTSLGRLWSFRDVTERKEAEQSLLESEERLRLSLRSANQGLYDLNIQTGTAFVNDEYATMLGYDPKTFVETNAFWIERLHPDDKEHTAKEYTDYISGKINEYSVEFRQKTQSGEWKWILSSGEIVSWSSDGRPLRMLGIHTDIDERKRGEEAIRQSEIKFRALFENANDAIFLMKDGIFMECNAMTEKMFACSREEILKRKPHEFSPPLQADGSDSEAMSMKKIKAALAGEPQFFEWRHKKYDGTLFDAEVSLNRIQVQDDVMIQAIVRDISERKIAENSLLESEEKYKAFFDDDLTGDFISTPDGKLLACNPAFAKMFGYDTVDEALKMDVHSLYSDKKARENVISRLKREKRLEYFSSELIRKDGKKIYVIENMIGTFNKKDELTEIKGYLFDDTQRRSLETQLIQAQKMESLGTLAGGIAHDFNNILAIIMGHTSLIRRKSGSDEHLIQNAETITKATQRGASLVKQLLTFARKTDAVLESILIQDTINEIRRFIEQTFPKTITITGECEKDLPPILADGTQVHQVLLNLTINARDAMPHGGALTITAHRITKTPRHDKFGKVSAAEYIHVKVSDTGTGMDEETKNRIFEPFFTTKGRERGTGLGLATVYGIVESHHGFIDVESEIGKGSTFNIFFPVQQSFIQHEIDNEIVEEIPGGDETILVVDDEESMRYFLESILTEKGYHILSAADGQAALDLFTKHDKQIDLILTDLGLPKMSGEELVSHAIKTNPNIKIIVASGFFENKLKAALTKAGVKEFVQKPYSPDEILKKVREVIDLK